MFKALVVTALCVCFSLEGRVYFLHVPKTGGTTLRLLLEQQVSLEEIYPHRNRLTATTPINQELVSGHIPYWLCKQLDPQMKEAFKITILRHPVERYLSFLRAKKKADKLLPDLESVLRLRRTPNNRYREGLIDNALCRYLAQQPNLEGKALLESAKQALATFDAILFFDHFAADVLDLFERLEIVMQPTEIPKMNATEQEPVSPSLLREVERLNALDLELYQYAKSRQFRKDTTYNIRQATFSRLLATTTEIDYTFDLPLLGRGWTYRESDPLFIYRWVTDQPADIYFPLAQGKHYKLQFYAKPLTAEITPKLQVNGCEMALNASKEGDYFVYEGEIPENCIQSDRTKLTFHANKTALYREIYPSHHNKNYPPLAFAVGRILISNIHND